MAKTSYTPISTFWAMFVPGVLAAVVWYAYNSQGWVSHKVQSFFGPIVEPTIKFFARVL